MHKGFRYTCKIHDSELTSRGTKRKVIFIGACGANTGKEAKRIALIDFTASKTPIVKIDRITPYPERHPHSSCETREHLSEHDEWGDLAVAHMKYIL